jgi:hypothetical protein
MSRAIPGYPGQLLSVRRTTRTSEEHMQRRRLLVTAAVGLALYGCGNWRSPWSFDDVDVSESRTQELLRLADRPERVSQGFAPLPTTGRMSLGRLKWYRAAPAGWEAVTLSAHIQSSAWSRAWYFGRKGDRPIFLWETETIHSRNSVRSSSVGNGHAFWEYVENDFASQDAPFPRPGHHVWHVGESGQQEMPLEDALALARTWFAPGSNWTRQAGGGEQGIGPDERRTR